MYHVFKCSVINIALKRAINSDANDIKTNEPWGKGIYSAFPVQNSHSFKSLFYLFALFYVQYVNNGIKANFVLISEYYPVACL